MQGRRVSTGVLIAALLILATIIAGIFLFRHYGHKARPWHHALPADFAVLAEVRELRGLLQKLDAGQGLPGRIMALPALERSRLMVRQLDSLLGTDLHAGNILDGTMHFLATWQTDDTAMEVLWVTEFSDARVIPGIREFLSDRLHARAAGEKGFRPDHLEVVEFAGGRFFFFFRDNLLVGSPDPAVTEAAFFRLRNNAPPAHHPRLLQLHESSGKSADATIFLQHGPLSSATGRILAPGIREDFDLSKLADISAYDIIIRSDELVINGFTVINDSAAGPLLPLKGASTREMSLHSALPATTFQFLWFGTGDFRTYLENTGKTEYTAGKAGSGSMLSHPYALWLADWVDDEFARAKLVLPGRGEAHETIAVFRSRPGTEPLTRPHPSIRSFGTVDHRGISIRCTGDMLGELFPGMFPPSDSNYLASVEGCIIAGNDPGTVRYVIDCYLQGRTLNQDRRFKDACGELSGSGNMVFYQDLTGICADHPCWNGEASGHRAASAMEGLTSFLPALAVQYSWLDPWFFTSVSMPYDTGAPAHGIAVWEGLLDATLQSGPYILGQAEGSRPWIFVTDAEDKGYLFDLDGRLLWEKQLPGRVMAPPALAPFGESMAMLLPVGESIHCLDGTGDEWPGFPVTLDAPAVTSPVAVNTPGNKAPRIIIGCENKVIYAFDQKGQRAGGWTNPQTGANLSKPPQVLAYGSEDYIILTQEDGQVRFLDRNGRDRIRPKGKLIVGSNSFFYTNRTNSKGIFLTTGINGHLVYVSASGNTQETVFGNFPADHFFAYADVDGRNGHDFVYFDGENLTVFDRFKKKICSVQPGPGHDFQATLLQGQGRVHGFCLISEASGMVILSDPAGNLQASGIFEPSSSLEPLWLGENQLGIVSGKGSRLSYSILQGEIENAGR